ncbi:MAG: hypothetical protein O3A87_04615 [Verrucomicrobia bacterium]|nr:hypothetical protein [Verrucomicrobiota bacterium]MDA1005750.1 hypothetical protein [Verrucomicrobiota bacterium]
MNQSLSPVLSIFLWSCAVLSAAPVLVNEFNAVSSSQTLAGGGVDNRFGFASGNGGDWVELVVVGTGAGSTVDLRGWRVESQGLAVTPFVAEDVIILSSNAYWAAVPAGTILTFMQDRTAEGGMDTVLNAENHLATEGWAHSNVWIGDPTLITYVDATTNGYTLDPVNGVIGYNVSDDDTQIRLRNGGGTIVFGPAGEGVRPSVGEISNQELFTLLQAPSSLITATSHYGDSSDGTDAIAYSSFGAPNRWSVAGQVFDQSFSGFRPGAAPPVFLSSQADVDLFSGVPFSYSIQSLDADGDPLVLAMLEGPGFLTLVDNGNGTGQLSGTAGPGEAGTYLVRLQVADNGDGLHQQVFLLTVIPPTSPVIVNEYNAVSSTEVLGEEWSFDQRFGRVQGNGDDWIELVVVGNGAAGSTVDMRGWRVKVTEDGAPAGTIVLTTDPFWQAVPAGMILTFTESNASGGGWDTSLFAENRLAIEGWAWSNVYLGDATLIDQGMSTTELGITGENTRISILNSLAATMAGPYGEGVYSGGAVSNAEVFRLAANPSPGSNPYTPQYSDASTSTFGYPNRLPEDDGTVSGFPAGTATGYQSFAAFATGASSRAPYFTNLWGPPDTNNTLPGSVWAGPPLTAADPDHGLNNLVFSLVSPPSGMVLLNNGAGTASLSWTPNAGQIGIHKIEVKVSDPAGAFLTRSVTVAVLPATSPVLVNEYNAVSSSRYLNGGTAALDVDGGMAMDAFHGRVPGNGGDWIELVVVGNGTAGSTVDLRGWRIDVSENFGPVETIVLSQHPYFSAVQAGTILTFVESDTIAGGLDSAIQRVNRLGDLGYAWTNIVIGDGDFVDQTASNFGSSIAVTSDETEIVLRNAAGVVMNGPVGEPRITRNVNVDEIFHLEKDPLPGVTASAADPGFPNYADNWESSSFGAPNQWEADNGAGGTITVGQSFAVFVSGIDTNSIPTFTQLPTILYGLPGKATSQAVTAVDYNGNGSVTLSVGSAPPWVSLIDSGNGAGFVNWTPPAGVSGFQEISIVASDGVDSVVRTFSIFVHGTPASVILNEYNAVSASSFLNGGTAALDSSGGSASDEHFGRVAKNGGDWFELVVVGDDGPGVVDLRGWKVEVSAEAGFPFVPKVVVELSNDTYWAAVPNGTILTFVEDRTAGGGMDTSIGEVDQFASEGWGWSNVWIGDPQYITYTSPEVNGYAVEPGTGVVSNFDITSVGTQFVIRDSAGNVVYGPVGEGIGLLNGVTTESVWELVGDPRSTVTPHDVGDPGVPIPGAEPSLTGSTFGHPNQWGGGLEVQDFSVFKPDAIYDAYVGAAGLSGGSALFDFDADGDGFTNGQEFAHGTNPNGGGSTPVFRGSVGSSLGMTFVRRAGGVTIDGIYYVDGIEMTVEYSTTLVGWAVTSLQASPPVGLPALPAGYEYVSFLLPQAVFDGSAEGFLRVRVNGP